MRDLFIFPKEANTLLKLRLALSDRLRQEYHVESDQPNLHAIINGITYMSIESRRYGKSPPKLWVDLGIPYSRDYLKGTKDINFRVYCDVEENSRGETETKVDLEQVRREIQRVEKEARERGLFMIEIPFKAVPDYLLDEHFKASEEMLAWLGEFAPEILRNPHFKNIEKIMARIRVFQSSERIMDEETEEENKTAKARIPETL